MKEFREKGNIIEITLDNGKVVPVMTKYIYNMMEQLEIDMDEALLTWLADEEYLINDEQEELNTIAKENKVKIKAKKITDPTKKTQRERVVKENPEKESFIRNSP